MLMLVLACASFFQKPASAKCISGPKKKPFLAYNGRSTECGKGGLYA